MDVGVDEDVDEVLVEECIDLFPHEGPLGELMAPVTPLGREQQKERPALSAVVLDDVIGVLDKIDAGFMVLVGKRRDGRRSPQHGAHQGKDAGPQADRIRHRYRRARSSRTFPRSDSLPSSFPTRSTSTPSRSSSRMVSVWEIV